jgi:hypothetical protein
MAPFGHNLTCCSIDAPHQDFCRPPLAGKTTSVSALHTAVLHIRQAALSAVIGFVGEKNIMFFFQLSWRLT